MVGTKLGPSVQLCAKVGVERPAAASARAAGVAANGRAAAVARRQAAPDARVLQAVFEVARASQTGAVGPGHMVLRPALAGQVVLGSSPVAAHTGGNCTFCKLFNDAD